MLSFLNPLREITFLSVLVRMLTAVLCGGLIGIERSHKGRAAGFRSHIFVCLGAAMPALTGQYLMVVLHQFTDVTRLGAQVIAGIGIIGAGTIVISRNRRVKGLTTAASLWTCAIIGLCCGAGFYEGAVIATILVLIAETLFAKIEYRYINKSRGCNLLIEHANIKSLNMMLKYMKDVGVKVVDFEIMRDNDTENNELLVNINILIHHKLFLKDVIKDISDIRGVVSVQEV